MADNGADINYMWFENFSRCRFFFTLVFDGKSLYFGTECMSWKLCLFSCSRLVVTKGAGRQLTAPQSIKVKFTKLPLQDLVCSNPAEGIHVQCSVHGSQKISFQEGFIGDVFYNISWCLISFSLLRRQHFFVLRCVHSSRDMAGQNCELLD